MKNKILTVGLCAGLALTTVLGGCGAPEQPADQPVEVQQQEPELRVLGEEGDGPVMKLTNGLGSAIDGLSIEEAGAEDYGDDLVGADGPVEADATVEVAFPASDDESYDVQLVVGDDTYTLHKVDPTTMADATVKLSDDGLAYLVYEKDGAEESTLDDEQALVEAEKKAQEEAAEAARQEEARKAQEEADRQAEAERQAAAEREAAQAAEAQKQQSQPKQQTQPKQQAPAQSAPSQSEDSCIAPDDLILN